MSLLTLILSGCAPTLEELLESPSDEFIAEMSSPGANAMTTRTTPYVGNESTCPHEGSHIHFSSADGMNDGYVEIKAPVDGTIHGVNPCKILIGTDTDGFQIDIHMARDGGKKVIFEMSIEPQDGLNCSAYNRDGEIEVVDPNYYPDAYVYVEEGDEVLAGDLLADLPVVPDHDNTHVHFNLSKSSLSSERSKFCPNIFNNDITEEFGEYFLSSLPCDDLPETPTFCYQATEDEDLTGL